MMNQSLDERLALAMDPKRIQRFLTSLVPADTIAASPNRVEDCRLERVRYRAGEKATLSYVLNVAIPGNRRINLQVTGYLYQGGKARRLHRRLNGNAWYDADLGLLLQCFPQDFRIPHLAKLTQSPPGWIGENLLPEGRPRHCD